MLNQFGVADCSYDLTPQQLCEKIKDVDALIVRSATKVWMSCTSCLKLLSFPLLSMRTQHCISHSLLGWEQSHWTENTWHADLQSLLV